VTADDRAKAAEVLRAAVTQRNSDALSDAIAAALAAARADGEAAANQRWTTAVEGLAEEWEVEAHSADMAVARAVPRFDLASEAAYAMQGESARRAAARLRGLTTSSEEETA
jgi:hypothetical protein